MSVALLVLALMPARAPASAGPQFLERDRLVIRLDQLTPEGTWRVEIGNPGPATEAQVWLIGGVSDTLAVRNGGRVELAAAGKATVILVPGPRRQTGTGWLVLISQAGIDRRPVAVTAEPSLLERHWPGLAGAAVAILLGTAVLSLRRRRRADGEPQGMTPPKGQVKKGESRGFTHSDEPVWEDALNRREYAEHLAELARSATPPMVIGVFGEWGSGKTSMLLQVHELLESDRGCARVWFDPWLHQDDVNPVLPLLHAIVSDLGLDGRENVRKALRTVSEVLGSLVLSSTIKINLSDVQGALKAYDEENFRLRSERTRLGLHLDRLIKTALRAQGKTRLVVFIDDLDRCHVDKITALLEALKLYFSRDNCVFVLGVAKAPLVAALKEKYQDPVGEYLDKIVQFPFEMPRLSASAFAAYVEGLLNHDVHATKSLLVCGLRANPRAIKRFVNVLILQDRVARARKLDPYEVRVLAAVLLIRDGDADFYVRLMNDPTLLKRIAEDLETAGEDPLPAWPALPLRIVGELAESGTSVPDSVSAYIDLVRESPVPQSGDLVDTVRNTVAPPPREQPSVSEDAVPEASRLSRDALEDALATLAERVRRRVGQVVGEGELLTPLVRFPEETEARPASIDEILAQGTRLLIGGRPGTGKSVLAAGLARRHNEVGQHTAAVAVFLPFRALRTDIAEFDRMLTHALVEEYQISIADAYAIVQRGSLVLVLDGLDEIDDARRAAVVTRAVRWADLAGAGIIMTDRDPAATRPGFRLLTVEGVVPEEGRRLLRRVLGEHGADPPHLPYDLLGSPSLLAALTRDPAWIGELPRRPVDFLPWFAAWATRRTAEAGFGVEAVATALAGIARLVAETGQEVFSSDDPDVRTVFRRSGIKGMEVPSLLQAAVVAGLFRQVGPEAYHFVHPRLVDLVEDG